MKSVLISIQPKWCELITLGKKTVEVRKTKPKLLTPFKCYIYCTKGFKPNTAYLYKTWAGCGKVIGEFVCDEIYDGILSKSYFVDSVNIGYDKTCVSIDEIAKYLDVYGTCGMFEFYGWHISDLVIYDKPKELNEFVIQRKITTLTTEHNIEGIVHYPQEKYIFEKLTRPPQSWCYVEALE